MFIKTAAAFFSTAAQIDACEAYGDSSKAIEKNNHEKIDINDERKISSQEGVTRSDTGNDERFKDDKRKISSQEGVARSDTGNDERFKDDNDLSEDSEDYGIDLSAYGTPSRSSLPKDVPVPPFTPGIPGLVSPIPHKRSYGVTPPRPPHHR